MSVQHHLDQPLLQINLVDISPGFLTQVYHYIYDLTEMVKSFIKYRWHQQSIPHLMQPKIGLNLKREAAIVMKDYTLKLSIHWYNRYSIGKCLLEAAYEAVLSKCKYTPYFHWRNIKLELIKKKMPLLINSEYFEYYLLIFFK